MAPNKPYNGKRITVLTPFYNCERYFDEYLNGLLGQTVEPTDIVIVDDGSTDNSVSYVSEKIAKISSKSTQLECNDNRVKSMTEYDPIADVKSLFKNTTIKHIVLNKNYGSSTARNVAVTHSIEKTPEAAKNQIFACCDADDYYYPEKLEKSTDVIFNSTKFGLVYSDFDILKKSGSRHRVFKEQFYWNRMNEWNQISNNSVFRADLIYRVGLFDTKLSMCQDYDMWLRLTCVTCAYHIPESLYLYREHGDSITSTSDDNKIRLEHQILHAKNADRLKGKPVEEIRLPN